MTSVRTDENKSDATDSQPKTTQSCGGMVGALFVAGVYAVGMLTTIMLLIWFVVKCVEIVTSGS